MVHQDLQAIIRDESAITDKSKFEDDNLENSPYNDHNIIVSSE